MYLKRIKKPPLADVLRNRCSENVRYILGKWTVLESLFLLSKGTPTQMLCCEYCEIFENSFFIEQLRWLLLKGSIIHFFTGKFPDSGKLYQQLELEYLNQRSWWDMYDCFTVLLNVQYIMLNNFRKNPFRHPNLTYYLVEHNSSKCYFPLRY